MRTLAAALAIMIVVLAPRVADAFINPGFTPANLVGGSTFIVSGHLAPDTQGGWKLDQPHVIKGDKAEVSRLTLRKPADDDKMRFSQTVGKGAIAVLLQGRDETGRATALCFVGGSWFTCQPGDGVWHVVAYNQNLLGTFSGDAAMLRRMAEALVRDPKRSVPSTAGVRWHAVVEVGQTRDVQQLLLIRAGEEARPHAYVAALGGDRIISISGRRRFADVTEALGLQAKSRYAVILDATGNGHDDVVSWDGQGLRLHAFDGKWFESSPPIMELADCLGLAAISRGGVPGIVVNRPDRPVLLMRKGDGWSQQVLPGDLGVEGETGSLLVADLDHYGRVDILQTGTKGSRWWRGTADGFADSVRMPVRGGPGTHIAMADFDGDGWLDLYLNGPGIHGMWENDGQGRFREVTALAGWLGSKAVPDALAVFAEDLNHDQLPDVGLLYQTDPTQYHFNRGFRTFTEEGEVRLEKLPDGTHPVAATVSDFNRDGSADLVVAVNDGRVLCFFNDLYDVPALRVMMGDGASDAPAAVRVYEDSDETRINSAQLDDVRLDNAQLIGVFHVPGAGPGTHITLRGSKPVIVVWRDAAGKEHRQRVVPEAVMTTPVVLKRQ